MKNYRNAILFKADRHRGTLDVDISDIHGAEAAECSETVTGHLAHEPDSAPIVASGREPAAGEPTPEANLSNVRFALNAGLRLVLAGHKDSCRIRAAALLVIVGNATTAEAAKIAECRPSAISNAVKSMRRALRECVAN